MLKNFFEKIKAFFIKTKDFNALMTYIVLFCCMGFIVLGALFAPLLIIAGPLEYPYEFLLKLLKKIGLQEMPLYLFIFSLYCIPMAITKLFLEKKWSKYLNYFFDHIQYPTIVLICYIAVIRVFNIDMEGPYWMCANYTFYSVYFIVFIRKFIKPVYKHFFKIYFCLIILLEIFTSHGD